MAYHNNDWLAARIFVLNDWQNKGNMIAKTHQDSDDYLAQYSMDNEQIDKEIAPSIISLRCW